MLGTNEASHAFRQVITTWKRLTHRNIVPLLDFAVDHSQLILDWTFDKDLMNYVADHPDVNRLSLVGFPPVAYCGDLTRLLVIRRR